MKLALFDIDGTLLRVDSEAQWCDFLTRRGLCDMSGIDEFVETYTHGGFDVYEFMRFQLLPLTKLSNADLEQLRAEFMRAEILTQIPDVMRARVEEHRALGHVVIAISAAHDFLAAPITEHFQMDAGLYTIGEQRDGRYTGEVSGTPCFAEQKIVHLERWLASSGHAWDAVEESWFYSDSYNDRPLLEKVNHAIAVSPDPRLRELAQAANWEIVEFD